MLQDISQQLLGADEQRQIVSQELTTTELSTELQFSRVALFTGRPLYWLTPSVSPSEYAQRVGKLLEWCLGLPDVQLGIDPQGIGLIVRGIYERSGQDLPADIDDLLNRVGAREEGGVSWPADLQIWQSYLPQLTQWLSKVSEGYIWVSSEEASWWVTVTIQSLEGYAKLFQDDVEQGILSRLLNRYRCTLFAPFDGPAFRNHLMDLMGKSPAGADRPDFADSTPVWWSWQLINFASVDNNIIYMPLLALWSDWPSSRRWAPPPPATYQAHPPFSNDEAARFLEDVLWRKIETLFYRARLACELGVAEPKMADRESRPSVFYFAVPTTPPARREDYASERMPAIYPLVKSCLGSDDPLSEEVAWGTLEGDLVVLRREMICSDFYQSWYLLLPTAAKHVSPKEIEEDLGMMASGLTYLEFSFGHEARDVYTDIEPLSTRRALWGGTLDAVSYMTDRVFDLLPTLGQSDFKRVSAELAALDMVLHRLQERLEEASSDTVQVQLKFNSYMNSSEDYLRRVITFAPIPNPWVRNLRDALLDAYPYHYLKQPLQALQSGMDFLLSRIGRTSTALSTVLGEADRRTREQLTGWTGRISFLIALLALLVTLVPFISGTQIARYPTWFNSFVKLSWLEPGIHIVVDGVGLVLLVAFVVYAAIWLYQHLPHNQRGFIDRVQRFRSLIDQARNSTGSRNELELLDEKATEILATLWDELRQRPGGRSSHLLSIWKTFQARLQQPFRSAQVVDWLQQARILIFLTNLFDLSSPIIPLPRALCIFRYKSTDFQSRTMVSEWDFEVSLRRVGFQPEEIKILDVWLSNPMNQRQIQQGNVRDFAETLKSRGVSADPQKRTVKNWQGSLNLT